MNVFDFDGSRLHLRGTLDARMSSGAPELGDLLFSLTFRGVLALQVVEIDSGRHADSLPTQSSFDEVVGSRWVEALGGKVDPSVHKHYVLRTYDHVLEIVCAQHEMQIYRPSAPETAPGTEAPSASPVADETVSTAPVLSASTRGALLFVPNESAFSMARPLNHLRESRDLGATRVDPEGENAVHIWFGDGSVRIALEDGPYVAEECREAAGLIRDARLAKRVARCRRRVSVWSNAGSPVDEDAFRRVVAAVTAAFPEAIAWDPTTGDLLS